MTTPVRTYQQLEAQIEHCAPDLRLSSVHRLALLTLGVAAREHCTLRGVARELTAIGLTTAQPESTAMGQAASAARCTNNVDVDSRCPRTTIWWHDRVA